MTYCPDCGGEDVMLLSQGHNHGYGSEEKRYECNNCSLKFSAFYPL